MKNTIAVLFILYMLLDSILPGAKKPAVSLRDIPEYLQQEWTVLKQDNLVDGVLLIEKDGKLIYSEGNSDEVYPVASLSKSFVGFRFKELQKNKKIDVEEKVCHWMQNFCSGKLKMISLNHLLDHRGGFGRDLSLFYFLKRQMDSNWDLKNLDRLEVADADLKATPGTEFNYSNFGYLLLSRILEKVEGKNFREVVQDLAQRYHLESLQVAPRAKTFPNSVLVPWTTTKWTLCFEGDGYKSFGTGGVVISARDLLRWLKVLEENDGLTAKSSQTYQAGLVRGENSFWHNGASLGNYGFMATVPSEKMKVVMLTKNFKPTKLWTSEIEKFETIFY
jgi:CubicO group peptidase (beta-lactamase class C family)